MLPKTAIYACAALCFATSTAFADAASEFLASLDGKFRGRGMATLEFSDEEQRVSCRIENKFDQSSSELKISGECASTQGKTTVRGKLSVKDGEITGSFISPFPNSELTTSNGVLKDGSLVVSATFVDNDTGNLRRFRQIVSTEKENGFSSSFQSYDNASKLFKEAGSMEFSRTE